MVLGFCVLGGVGVMQCLGCLGLGGWLFVGLGGCGRLGLVWGDCCVLCGWLFWLVCFRDLRLGVDCWRGGLGFDSRFEVVGVGLWIVCLVC